MSDEFKQQVCSGPQAQLFAVWCGTMSFAQMVCSGPQASQFKEWCAAQTGGSPQDRAVSHVRTFLHHTTAQHFSAMYCIVLLCSVDGY